MNKKITLLTITAIVALFMSVTSCKKASSNTDQLATLGKTTITGKVWAQLIDTLGSGIQYAPAGTTIAAWVSTGDLIVIPDAGATYANRFYTATVDGSGNYTLTVDVSMYQPATIHIMPAQFTYNQVIPSFPGPGTTTQRKVYDGVSADVTVINGVASIKDLMYN